MGRSQIRVVEGWRGGETNSADNSFKEFGYEAGKGQASAPAGEELCWVLVEDQGDEGSCVNADWM